MLYCFTVSFRCLVVCRRFVYLVLNITWATACWTLCISGDPPLVFVFLLCVCFSANKVMMTISSFYIYGVIPRLWLVIERVHGVNSWPCHCHVTTLGKLFTNVPLSPSSIICCRPNGGDVLRLVKVWSLSGQQSCVTDLVIYLPATATTIRGVGYIQG